MHFDHPKVRLDLLSDFYPVSLIGQELTGEFRQVVNVFIDIPMDPTEESFVTPFMETLFALQRRYGGFFLRPDMGDKGFNILMVWGAPIAHENDIDRALNFVLDLREQTGVEFRAGITYKPAYAGFIGTQLREDYTAYGVGVNLASRMMEAASRGEFWLDEEVVKRASMRFQMEDLGFLPFKGFENRFQTYRLRNRKRLVELAYRGAMVGRREERIRLLKFLEPLKQDKSAGVLILRGEAGIGKSRLIYELQDLGPGEIAESEWVVLQSDDIVREPLNPFKNWLMQYLGISEEQGRSENERAFEAGLRSLIDLPEDPGLAAEILRTSSVLAALVNLEQPGSLYDQLDAKGRHDNTLIALDAVLLAIAAQKKVILLIEDLQWLDEESRLFLAYFIRKSSTETERDYPTAILITSRSEMRLAEVDQLANVEYLDLGPLAASHIAELARSLLDGEASNELVKLIEQRSDGNPFFAEQVMRYLMEKDLIERGGDGLFRARKTASEQTPTDVQAVLIARLDRLSREIRDVVQTASVLGREFEIRVLASMLRGDDRLIQKVMAAEESEIWFPLNEMEYIFRHGLLRDAAYGMQLLTRQRELHALAVEAMELLYSDDLSPHLGELAHHAERANMNARAFDYLIRAFKAAADAYQNLQALDYLTRAIALAPTENLAARFELYEKRVDLYSRIANRDEQTRDLDRLDALAGELNEAGHYARAAGMRSSYHFVLGNYPETIQFAESAISLGRPSGEMDTCMVAYNNWAMALLRQSKLKTAMKIALEGLELTRQQQNKYFQGLTLNTMGIVAHMQEDPDSAERALEEADRLATEIGDRALLSKINTNLGNVAGTLRGDYAAARRYYEQGLSILEEQGDRYGQSVLLLNMAWAAGIQGDFPASRAYNKQAVTYRARLGTRNMRLTR